MVQNRVRRAARSAGLAQQGVHVLRHTFCSHLSMRGAPVAAIQALAGHADLSTTQRYMHLSPLESTPVVETFWRRSTISIQLGRASCRCRQAALLAR